MSKLSVRELLKSKHISVSDTSDDHTRWNILLDSNEEYTYLVHNLNYGYTFEIKNEDSSIDVVEIYDIDSTQISF